MLLPLRNHPHYHVKRGKAVFLVKDLPAGRSFGNQRFIPSDPYGTGSHLRGEVTSNGFEGGMLRVCFTLPDLTTENVQFNEFSAENYLVCDYL